MRFPLNALVVLAWASCVCTTSAITLQIPTRPTQFPLTLPTYLESGNAYNQATLIATNVVQLAIGGNTTAAVINNGTLKLISSDQRVFNQPPGLGAILDISISASTSWPDIVVALQTNGVPASWGYGWGNGISIGTQNQVTNLVQVTPGTVINGAWGLGLKNDGTLVQWGLGTGSSIISDLNSWTNIVQLSSGAESIVGLTSDGKIKINGLISTPNNSTNNITNVVQVFMEPTIGNYAIVLRSDGTVVTFGDYYNGETNYPAGLSNVVQVSAWGYNLVALKSDGTVVSWGNSAAPIPSGLTNVIQVVAGYQSLTSLVAMSNQTVSSFPPIGPQTSGIPFTITNVPTASSGLPVTLSIQGGNAIIYSNTITPYGVGTVTLAATQPGMPWVLNSAKVTTNITIVPANQTFANPFTNNTYVYSNNSINLPINSDQGQQLLYIVSGPANLNGLSAYNYGDTAYPGFFFGYPATLNFTGIGTVTLIAANPGGGDYNALNATNTFVITKGYQTVNGNTNGEQITGSQSILNSPHQLQSSTDQGLSLHYSVLSGPANITTSNGQSFLNFTGNGAVTLVTASAANQNYNPISFTNTFLVTTVDQTFAWSLSSTSVPLQITGTNSILNSPIGLQTMSDQGLPLAYSVATGNATLATNYENGSTNSSLTLLGSGNVTLVTHSAGNLYYNPVNFTNSFVVAKASQSINPISYWVGNWGLSSSYNYGVNSLTIPNPPTASSGLPISFSVLSGPAIISGNVVTITGAGQVTLAADQPGNSLYAAAQEVTASFYVNTPTWPPPTKQQYATPVIATVLDSNGNPIKSAGSILAAFNGGQVAGVTTNTNGSSTFGMVVSAQQPSVPAMSYQLYNAQTGQVIPILEPLNFSSLSQQGTIGNPLILHQATSQNIPISPGWNWISFNVFNTNSALTNALGSNAISFLMRNYSAHNNDVIKGINGFATYTSNSWYPSTNTFNVLPGQMYQLSSTATTSLLISGAPASSPIKISLVSGWNWLGCPRTNAISISTFLNTLAASTNDTLLTQTSFLTYYGGSWTNYGTNFLYQPGAGYLLYVGKAQTNSF